MVAVRLLIILLLEESKRAIIYTEIIMARSLRRCRSILTGFASSNDCNKFHAKARAFLLSQEEVQAIQELRQNESRTAEDLKELERSLTESGATKPDNLSRPRYPKPAIERGFQYAEQLGNAVKDF